LAFSKTKKKQQLIQFQCVKKIKEMKKKEKKCGNPNKIISSNSKCVVI
jgi:hypothetical protein